MTSTTIDELVDTTNQLSLDDDYTANKIQLIRLLNGESIDHHEIILTKKTLKQAHIYCKINNLSGIVAGNVIEKYIVYKNGLIKNKSTDGKGDCVGDNNNYEIKISLGGKDHNKFNYVQLRLNHNISYYILTAYYLDKSNIDALGTLFVFMLDSQSIKQLICNYGNYAHGTVKTNGEISKNPSLLNINIEYAIRPKYGDACWNELLKNRIDEYLLN